MGERKLIRHGPSSLTMSLPMGWIKQRGLKKGDSVFVDVEGDHLVIGTEKGVRMGKISVDITGLDRTSVIVYMQSLYRFGYEEVELKFRNRMVPHYRKGEDVSVSSVLHYVVGRLIGFEVIEEKANVFRIKYLQREEREDFKVVLRRIFILISNLMDDMVSALEKNDSGMLETVEDRHDNITKFVSYCLRLLNKFGYPDVKKTCFYYHVIASLDKLTDILKFCARDSLKMKIRPGKEAMEVMKVIKHSFDIYHDMFYKFDMKKADSLNENRTKVKDMIFERADRLPGKDLMTVSKFMQIVEILLDLSEARMGLEY